MSREIFYHGTTKTILVCFASVFDDIKIVNGHGDEVPVPLVYSPKEKFIEDLRANADMKETNFDVTLPRMGFEITGINSAPERNTSPMNKLQDPTLPEKYMLNRTAYDVSIELTIATRFVEDSFRIVEQIIPFFTPELTITIVGDHPDFKMENHIPIVLDSVGLNIDYEGTFDSRRTILWTLGFTVKAFYYSNPRSMKRIKQGILELHNADFDDVFERITSTVVPRTANKTDPHTIETVVDMVKTE